MFGRRRKGLGCREDLPDHRDHPLSLNALEKSPPAAYDMFGRVGDVGNQLGTNSCVGWAIRQGLFLAMLSAGWERPEYVSPSFIYKLSREVYGQKADIGTYIRTAFKAVTRCGAPAEQYWPFKARDINKAPNWKAHWHAFDQRGPRGYERIIAGGDERLEQLRRCISSGVPVVYGTPVSRAFLESDGPDVEDIPILSPIAGRHAMCIVGYDDRDNFRVVSSWGDDWRIDGSVWVTERYVSWSRSADFWAVRW